MSKTQAQVCRVGLVAIVVCGWARLALAEDQPLFTVTTNEETKVVTVRRTRNESATFSQSFPDAGTIRMAAGAQSPFFSYLGTDPDRSASTFAVSAKPLTFDAEADADAKLGLPLSLSGVDQEIVVLPTNNSFEDGETGWTWANVNSGTKVGVQQNGSQWVSSSCKTSYGDKYYTLRCLHKLTSADTVTLTAASAVCGPSA